MASIFGSFFILFFLIFGSSRCNQQPVPNARNNGVIFELCQRARAVQVLMPLSHFIDDEPPCRCSFIVVPACRPFSLRSEALADGASGPMVMSLSTNSYYADISPVRERERGGGEGGGDGDGERERENLFDMAALLCF